ncbi:MAG: PKD-like family lipoprotein [Rikenellaceae bacterium]|nr:PKD-like family lipoprotein [Rikenellaceae bacterium]MCL2693083.1 PKD-like family lipoprotein [Rikenellaceae bacterium]
MKRYKYITTLLIVMSMAFTWSCYEDKSSFDAKNIDGIVIDASSIDEVIRVGYLDQLQLSPGVSKGDNTDPGLFSYTWQIAYLPGPVYETIGEEKDLNAIITKPIQAAPYTLIYTVTDDATGLQKQYSWDLYVSSQFGEGIVVFDTRDGVSSDISLIMDNPISADYSKGRNITYNILETATGSAYPSLARNMTYSIAGSWFGNYTNIIMAVYENKDILMYDCKDYSVYKTSADLFPIKSTTYNPQRFVNINQAWGMVENNKFYAINSNQATVSFLMPAAGHDGSEINVNNIDNEVLSLNHELGLYGNAPKALWYDNQRGKFFGFASMFSSPPIGPVTMGGDGFDPGNLPNRRAVAGGMSVNGNTHSMLLKNTLTDNYELYLMPYNYYNDNWDWIVGAPKSKLDLPAGLTPVLNSAVSIFFSPLEPIMYVATSTNVYAVTYGGGIVAYSVKYTAPAGETIAKARMFIQGRYYMDASITNNGTQVPWNFKAVVIATQSSQYAGNVYVIPQINHGSGDLDGAAALRYTGFGKILDIVIQGK